MVPGGDAGTELRPAIYGEDEDGRKNAALLNPGIIGLMETAIKNHARN
jgi:hypothetical protein